MTTTIQASATPAIDQTPVAAARVRIAVIIDVDPVVAAPYSSAGITEEAHRDVRNVIDDVLGPVVEIVQMPELEQRMKPALAAVPMPVPMARTIPVSNEKTRAAGRRRTALEAALQIAQHAVTAGYSAPSDEVLANATRFEAFLNGEYEAE